MKDCEGKESEQTKILKEDEGKSLKLLCIIGVLIALFFVCYWIGYLHLSNRAIERYQETFNIAFPDDMKEILRKIERQGQESGNYYFVYEFKEEPVEFFEKNGFSRGKNLDLEDDFHSHCSRWILNGDKFPNFYEDYYWKEFKDEWGYKDGIWTQLYQAPYEISMIYCPSELRLYLID